MARTESPPSVALATPALTPDEIELDERCRQLWRVMFGDDRLRAAATAHASPIRHLVWRLFRAERRSDPLEGAGRLIVELAARGAAESQLRPIPLLLDEVLTSCYAGTGGPGSRTLAEIDRAEIEVDHREDVAAQERHLAAVSGSVTPELLDAQAEADETASAVLLERARLARREARRIRRERTAPAWAGRRQRVGARLAGSVS